MTVESLIEKLKKLPPDADVYYYFQTEVNGDVRYTYLTNVSYSTKYKEVQTDLGSYALIAPYDPANPTEHRGEQNKIVTLV